MRAIIIGVALLLLAGPAWAATTWDNGYGGQTTWEGPDKQAQEIREMSERTVEAFVDQCEGRKKTDKCLKKMSKYLRKNQMRIINDYVVPHNQSATGCIVGRYKGAKKQKSMGWAIARGDEAPAGALLVRTAKQMQKHCNSSKYWLQWDFFWAGSWGLINAAEMHERNHRFGGNVGHGRSTIEKKLDKKYGPKVVDGEAE